MTNDEGQMRNRWGRLKISRRWGIVLAAIAIATVLAYVAFRKPAVLLEVVELKQEPLRRDQGNPSDPRLTTTAELHLVAELELQNNSSSEIQYAGFFSNQQLPNYECHHWTDSGWEGDSGSAASHLAFSDHYKRVGEGSFAGQAWGLVSLRPGGSLKFRVASNERGKPFIVALRFRTPRPDLKFYDLLPDAVVACLPWRKEWHQVKSGVVLNGAKEMPPRWTSKPDISKSRGQ